MTSIHHLFGVSESLSILLHYLLTVGMSLTLASKTSSSLPKGATLASQQTVWSINKMVQCFPEIFEEISSERCMVSRAFMLDLLFGGWSISAKNINKHSYG